MAKVSVMTLDEAPVVPNPASEGPVETLAYFAGGKDPIHTHVHRLQPGGRIRVEGTPADRAVFVWQGSVEAGGVRLDPQSSAIAEYGAAMELIGGSEGATLVEFHLGERRRPRATAAMSICCRPSASRGWRT
jgi:hypothetical protein